VRTPTLMSRAAVPYRKQRSRAVPTGCSGLQPHSFDFLPSSEEVLALDSCLELFFNDRRSKGVQQLIELTVVFPSDLVVCSSAYTGRLEWS
jgi:hypothetical protein